MSFTMNEQTTSDQTAMVDVKAPVDGAEKTEDTKTTVAVPRMGLVISRPSGFVPCLSCDRWPEGGTRAAPVAAG